MESNTAETASSKEEAELNIHVDHVKAAELRSDNAVDDTLGKRDLNEASPLMDVTRGGSVLSKNSSLDTVDERNFTPAGSYPSKDQYHNANAQTIVNIAADTTTPTTNMATEAKAAPSTIPNGVRIPHKVDHLDIIPSDDEAEMLSELRDTVDESPPPKTPRSCLKSKSPPSEKNVFFSDAPPDAVSKMAPNGKLGGSRMRPQLLSESLDLRSIRPKDFFTRRLSAPQAVPAPDHLSSQNRTIALSRLDSIHQCSSCDVPRMTPLPQRAFQRQNTTQRDVMRRAVSRMDSAGNIPPDGGLAWLVVLGASLMFYVTGGFFRTYTLVYRQLLDRYQDTAAATGWVPAMHGAVKMFSSPFVSVLVRRFPLRGVVIAGAAATSVGMAMNAFAPSLYFLYFSHGVVVALGINMVAMPTLIIIGQYFSTKRGRAMGVALMCSGLGGVTLAPVMEYLFREYGYTGTMLIVTALMLNLFPCGMLYLPIEYFKKNEEDDEILNDVIVEIIKEGKKDNAEEDSKLLLNGNANDFNKSNSNNNNNDSEDEDDVFNSNNANNNSSAILSSSSPMTSPNSVQKANSVSQCRRVGNWLVKQFGLNMLREYHVLLFNVLQTGAFMCMNTVYIYLSGFARELGASDFHISLYVMVGACCDVISRLASGFVFDHHRVRRRRLQVFAGLAFLTGVASLSCGFVQDKYSLLVCYALFAVFANAYHTQTTTVLSDLVRTKRIPSAVGLNRVFQGVGILVGPPLGGALKDMTKTYRSTFLFAGSSFLLFLFVFIVARQLMHNCSGCRHKRENPLQK